MSGQTIITFDGGSRGNPGPASGAAYTADRGGLSRTVFLPHATNNEAEYHGFLLAVRLAKEQGFENVLFQGDSKLVVSQVTGEWKVKSASLGELLATALAELKSLPRWRISWIPRAENADADRLANEAMDKALGIEPVAEEVEDERDDIRPDVRKLNALGAKADFNELRRLKVGGMDEYSRSSPEVLQVLLPRYDVLKVGFLARIEADPHGKKLDPAAREKLAINALRWVARGLKGELAIRKILIDNETSAKMREKRS